MWRECSPSERRSKGEMVGVWQSCPRGFAGGFSRGSGLAAMIWSVAEYVCKAVGKWLLREWCGKLAHEQRNEMERNGAKRNEVEWSVVAHGADACRGVCGTKWSNKAPKVKMKAAENRQERSGCRTKKIWNRLWLAVRLNRWSLGRWSGAEPNQAERWGGTEYTRGGIICKGEQVKGFSGLAWVLYTLADYGDPAGLRVPPNTFSPLYKSCSGETGTNGFQRCNDTKTKKILRSANRSREAQRNGKVSKSISARSQFHNFFPQKKI